MAQNTRQTCTTISKGNNKTRGENAQCAIWYFKCQKKTTTSSSHTDINTTKAAVKYVSLWTDIRFAIPTMKAVRTPRSAHGSIRFET